MLIEHSHLLGLCSSPQSNAQASAARFLHVGRHILVRLQFSCFFDASRIPLVMQGPATDTDVYLPVTLWRLLFVARP